MRWFTRKASVPYELRGVHISLGGRETTFPLYRGGTTTFHTVSGEETMRIGLAANGVLTVEQLAPILTLDRESKEWAAKP